ncbi:MULTISPECIES: ComEC/Rec2 family competence protein [unclassified Granulicatella]|uniref:ComEC/Rec2 family competence protein n=1 Tax=unclassified Granulicatella TaxID=2630493 RepID=UPI001ADDA746|nr:MULTISPECIES: ComEC/Rec2 family competence protein [unclassified Granulicatella]
MKNLWIFVCLTGVLGGLFWIYPTWWTISLLVLWIIRLFYFKHKKVLMYSSLFVLLIIGCILYKKTHTTRLQDKVKEQVITIFADTVSINGDSLSAKGDISGELVSIYYVLQTEKEQHFWITNTQNITIKATGQLEQYAKARNPYQFNYASYMLRYRQSYWKINVKAYTILNAQANWRQFIRKQCIENLPPTLTMIVNSLFFNVNTELNETFQSIGLLYLVNMSGIHIAWILNTLTKLLFYLGLTREKTTYIMKGVALFLGYLCGDGIGVQKAILLYLLGKRGTTLDRIAWVTMGLLIVNPYFLMHLGFQFTIMLSFFNYFFKKQRVMLWLLTLPLLSANFFEISALSLVALFPMRFVTKYIVMPCVVIGIILSKLPPTLFGGILYIVEQCFVKFVYFSQFLAAHHELKWITGRLPDERYLFIFICIILFGQLKHKHWRYWRFCLVIPIVLLFMPVYYEQIMMIDVGQGSSLLIQKGKNAVLIDTGGVLHIPQKHVWKQRKIKDVAKDILLPTLKGLGIQRLEGVIITHSDADHVQALEQLRKEMPIQHIYYGLGAKVNGDMPVIAPKTLSFNVSVVSILYPFKKGQGENDDSLILYMTFGELTWLITGDASQKIENELLKLYPKLKADVLVVTSWKSNIKRRRFY